MGMAGLFPQGVQYLTGSPQQRVHYPQQGVQTLSSPPQGVHLVPGTSQPHVQFTTGVQQQQGGSFPGSVHLGQSPSIPFHSSQLFASGSQGSGQATLLPNAFNTTTLQEPAFGKWNMDTGASSHLNDSVHCHGKKSMRYCVFLGNNLLSWSSKRQPTLSRSSAEAEYRGVANAVAETCWIRNLLRELHTPLSSATIVYCDNVSVVYLSSNPVQHQRTKHIEIDIHFGWVLVATGQVRVLHVPSRFQYADIFTKGLPSALFEEFRTSLSVRCPPAPTVSRRVCMAQRPVLMIRPDV
ncbi:ribonuclease H-like domain-containing protein [Tanacetum coccineum]